MTCFLYLDTHASGYKFEINNLRSNLIMNKMEFWYLHMHSNCNSFELIHMRIGVYSWLLCFCFALVHLKISVVSRSYLDLFVLLCVELFI